MPPLDDERRRLEELCLAQLRNFFLLLLSSRPNEMFATPVEALDTLGPKLDQRDLYHSELALPLHGTPDSVVSAIGLGDPEGELFALQEALTDALTDEGRLLLVRLGRLF